MMKKLEPTYSPQSASEPTTLLTAAELMRQVEQAKEAQERALLASRRDHRQSQALDRLCSAAFAAEDTDNLLHKLVELFVEAAGADAGVFCLREGDKFRARAWVGVEPEVAAACNAAFDGSSPSAEVITGDALRAKGFRSRFGLRLGVRGEVVAEVVLGAWEDRELSDEDRKLLDLLARHAAAAVQRALEEETLRSSIASRDEVLSAVAHDLKNPVNIIAITANGMLGRTEGATARRPIERILRGVQRAERLLRDLLEISAIESGRLALDRRWVEPADLVLAALESQHGIAEGASVIVRSDVAPELPPVEADEERLMEVFENLIGNAVKFSGANGSVTVGALRRGGDLLFWVKDTGPGITSEELPRVFDRFWHAKKANRRGTGLGLSICKGIVEAHGGRIWLESTPGKGTTVSFTIPIPDASKVATEESEVANILLVDDRPENLLSLKAILNRPDYRLAFATSGEEALALALRERFALALIDVAMPGMNGLEVAIHMKELERSRGIPIIFITAFGDDPQEIHRAYSAGGADYLVKPLDPEIVRKKVAVFVDLSRRRHEKNPAV